MKKLLLVFALLTVTASAQEWMLLPVKVNRFSATLSSANQRNGYSYNMAIAASKTDTTDWIPFNDIDIVKVVTKGFLVDTVIEGGINIPQADSMKASFRLQFGSNKVPTAAFPVDSIVYANFHSTAAAFNVRSKFVHLTWASLPPGSNMVRMIIATAATGNAVGDTYSPFFNMKVKK